MPAGRGGQQAWHDLCPKISGRGCHVGMSRRAAAERFGVSAARAVRWVRAWRMTAAMCAKPKAATSARIEIETFRDTILAAVDAQVDITLI